MHLLSCKNPQRVYNKYINEYVWVPCGHCSICKNRRAAHFTQLLEDEQLQHRYCFFVTLTYSDEYLPRLQPVDFEINKSLDKSYFSSRERDRICIPFSQLFDDKHKDEFDEADLDFFYDWIDAGGLPIASKSDCQLFLKRLNKYIHDKITGQYKNFRYFLVSEFGSTTFRPHYHAIFYCDNEELGNRFADCVAACWEFGRIDTQYVENSACAYCAQYVNKSDDLPYVYKNRALAPFYLCSRNPFIGTFRQRAEDDFEMVNDTVVETPARKAKDSTQYVNVPLQPCYQNRLFPKPPCYRSLSDTLRVEFYQISRRFRIDSLKRFIGDVFDYITCDLLHTELRDFLSNKLVFSDVKDELFRFDHRDPSVLFDKTSFNWLRRLYYFAKRVTCQACQFGYTLAKYKSKIEDYYNKKELWLLRKMYEYQELLAPTEVESIVVMYPEYLFQNGYTISQYIGELDCLEPKLYIADCDYYSYSNKKTHFKNAYLDSTEFRVKYPVLHKIIKKFYYAKKCNEAIEALAA